MTPYLDFSDFGTTRRKYLEEALQMAEHNLFCYSKGISIKDPKFGFNYEWGDAKEKVRLVKQMLNELPDVNGDCLFYGRVIDTENNPFILFEVSSPEKTLTNTSIIRIFKVSNNTQSFLSTYAEQSKNRYETDKPDVVKIKVNKSCILSMEWIDDWD